MTTTDIQFLRGDTVNYFNENGQRTGVVQSFSTRRSGSDWVHVIIEDGRTKRFAPEELHPSNDLRSQKVRALTPSEAHEAREAYLELVEARAARTRALWQDDESKTTAAAPKPRGRQETPVSQDKVAKVIAFVEKTKVATKSTIQAEVGEMTASEWNKTVKAILESGRVESHGKLRGTKYTVPGYEVEQVAPKDTTEVKDYAAQVFEQMEVHALLDNENTVKWSRAEITKMFPTDNGTYQAAMKVLLDSKKIVKTGAKRGTRYHVA